MEANQEHEMIPGNWVLPFPQKVYNMLKFCEEQGREDIASWVNDGTAFKVNDVQDFERDVLPNYFNTKKYHSFTRRLYAYGFACVRQGRQAGIYSHPSFNRNDPTSPSLVKRVKRVTKNKSRTDEASQKRNTTASNPSFETVNPRPSNQRPDGGIISDSQHILQFPSRPSSNETRCEEEDNDGTAAAAYPNFASQVTDEDLMMVEQEALPTGSELTGVFDNSSKGDSMVNSSTTRSYPDHASKFLIASTPNTKPIRTSFPEAAAKSSNGTITADDDPQNTNDAIISLFIPGSGHMAPIVTSPSRNAVLPNHDGSASHHHHESQRNLIPHMYHDAVDGQSRLQEQDDDLDPIPF